MRRILWLMLVLYAHCGYSIGFMYDPVVDEQYLVENRLLPFTDSVSGKREISVLVGLSSFGKKQATEKGK